MFSWIPGLPELKTYALVILGGLAAFGMFMWKVSQLNRVRDKVAGIKRTRQIEKSANKAALEGLQNEQDELNNIDTKRTDFN